MKYLYRLYQLFIALPLIAVYTVLTSIVVIAGAQSWNEIAEFGKSKLDFFKKRLQGLETMVIRLPGILSSQRNG